ncbi:M4 family metallopeptidase [Egbenema bharatensis]|uniref:M4 family metallopeptidase n=1 Tax=Egbenema bharatensis TaxID=3463334 RepID=UPI003A8A70AF
MLDHIIRYGDDQNHDWALETLRASEQLRGKRKIMGSVSPDTASDRLQRAVYDAKNSKSLPGVLVRSEGDPPSRDVAVNEAYDGAGQTYKLFRDVYNRNSIDDRGLRIDSTVHFDVRYDNAFWDGVQLVYGDGDERLFNRFTIALDVIGHELMHGIIQYEAGLLYRDESGALNESFSDIFGSLVKQHALNQTVDQADWLIGAGILTDNVNGIAIRSLKAPGTAYNDRVLGKDPQPSHYSQRYQGTVNDGGMHINSGIPNHAFYLASMAIGGFAWETTGQIWYQALREELRPRSNFQDAARATISIASNRYGENSREHRAIDQAWQQVGVI